jgi:hypothetical protein
VSPSIILNFSIFFLPSALVEISAIFSFCGTMSQVLRKGVKNLTQAFSDLVGLRQDSWECYPRFIALKNKQSLNPRVLSTRDQG